MSALAYELGICRVGDELKSHDDSWVILHLSHSHYQSGVQEKRFDKHIRISEMKWKVQTHFGSDSALVILQLKNAQGQVVAENMEDDKMLGFYSPQDGWSCHCMDLDPNAGQKVREWTDTSLVEKYMISEEDYDKRENTVRRQKEKMRAEGKIPPAMMGAEAAPKDPERFAEEAGKIKEGDRCMVFPGDRRGTVRYVGKIPQLQPGYWVGVEFDEPVGKNDGTAKGKRYFECRPSYGGFATPDKVTIGDFPPEDLFGDDDDLNEDGEL